MRGFHYGTPFLYLLTMPAAGSSSPKGCEFVKNNHIRIILCLFMCCALLFTCVARPASATSVAVVAGLAAIPTAVAVACAFQALGVMSSSNSTNFTTAVDNCSNWLTENSSFVVNGAVSLLGLTNAGVSTSYLQRSFVQDVWEWLFRSNTVHSATFSPGSDVTLKNGNTYYIDGPCLYRTCVFTFKNTAYCADIVISNQRYYYSGSDRKTLPYSFWEGSTQYFVFYQNVSIPTGSAYPSGSVYLGDVTGSYSTTETNVQASAFALLSLLNGGHLLGADNLTLGQIESPFQTVGTEEETIQIEIAPIYIDWTKYGVPDPNDPGGDDPDNDGKFPMWLPTGIPSPDYDDSVIKQNQQQAQSGVVSGDITFEPYEPDDPGTGGGAGSGADLSSVIQAIVNIPTVIVSGIGDFISDFFGFNGNYEDYTVQLRDFFPFCIPFDLYDFITVLSAEPEAPVFHWEIPVPQLGQTFELEVDLSAWDDIAVLFRNLELLAFIFGLAIMTREKFLRS